MPSERFVAGEVGPLLFCSAQLGDRLGDDLCLDHVAGWNTGRMSTSSPADLAVAFRSLPRRLDNASEDAPPSAVATARANVGAVISEVAGLLGAPVSGEGIAEAIGHSRPDDWTDSELVQIQAHADIAGRAIRVLADAGEASRD